MAKITIPKELFGRKAKDYTFAVLFLSIFSVFIVFAIRPSITTAFSLKKEAIDLKKVDDFYERTVANIVTIQTQVEKNRDELYIFDEAVTLFPEVNKMVEDVKNIADKNNFFIEKANIGDVNLIASKKTIDKVRLIIEGKAGFKNYMSFVKDLHNQRRLKTINKTIITRDEESTAEGALNIIITIDGYYL